MAGFARFAVSSSKKRMKAESKGLRNRRIAVSPPFNRESRRRRRRALPVQSVCRVTIVEKCSLEQRRKNAEIVWQWRKKKCDRLRKTRLPLLSHDAYARTSRVATINRSLISRSIGFTCLKIGKANLLPRNRGTSLAALSCPRRKRNPRGGKREREREGEEVSEGCILVGSCAPRVERTVWLVGATEIGANHGWRKGEKGFW